MYDAIVYLRRIYALVIITLLISIATALKVFVFTPTLPTVFATIDACRKMSDKKDKDECLKKAHINKVVIHPLH